MYNKIVRSLLTSFTTLLLHSVKFIQLSGHLLSKSQWIYYIIYNYLALKLKTNSEELFLMFVVFYYKNIAERNSAIIGRS